MAARASPRPLAWAGIGLPLCGGKGGCVLGKTQRQDDDDGIETKWWFWTTIIGTVLVTGGAIALGIALTTERPADRGDIQPGQVPAP